MYNSVNKIVCRLREIVAFVGEQCANHWQSRYGKALPSPNAQLQHFSSGLRCKDSTHFCHAKLTGSLRGFLCLAQKVYCLFDGKILRNLLHSAQSQTFQVCSFATKLVLLAFFSWKSTALGVIAFFLCLLLNQGFVVNVAKYYVFCLDADHLGMLLWKSLVFIPVFLLNRPKSTKFSYLPHQSLLFLCFPD